MRNRLEVIEYSNIQFTKAANVMRGMDLAPATNAKAKKDLADKAMAESADDHVIKRDSPTTEAWGFTVPAGGGKHLNSPTPGSHLRVEAPRPRDR